MLIKYHVNPKGLYIKRSYLKRVYRYEGIKAIILLEEEEAKGVAQNLDDKRVQGINDLDFVDAFSGQMEFGKLIQFSSFQFVGRLTSGSTRRITSNEIVTEGKFILISLKNNSNRFITPEDTEGFFEEVIKHNGGYFKRNSLREFALTT